MDQFLRSRFSSKSVPEFHDIHIHAESARPIDSCVGEVLDSKPRIRMSKWVDPDPSGRNDLHRTAEVLSAKFVPGKNPAPAPTSRDTNPFHPLKTRSGTRVAIRPVSPAPSSTPALVMSLVSIFQSVSSPSGHCQGSLKTAAMSYRLKLYFCCRPKSGVLPLKPIRGPTVIKVESSASPGVQTRAVHVRLTSTLKARKRWRQFMRAHSC